MKKAPLFLFLFLSGCAFAVQIPAFHVKKPPHGVYRGVFHVHSNFSHDSSADLETIQKTAARANLDFVVVTDHNNMLAEEAYRIKELPHDPLLVFGSEVSTSEGHLIMLGVHEDPPPDKESGQEMIDWIHEKGGYSIIPHPFGKRSYWKNWDVERFDGIEIYNFFHDIFSASLTEFALEFTFLPPPYFLKALDTPMDKSLALWNERLAKGKVSAVAGTDAHLHYRFHGFSPENLLLSFQSVNIFAIADSPDENKIVEAIGKGRVFTAFEAMGDAGSFEFTAEAGGKTYRMGESVPAGVEASFHVKAPAPAAVKLLRDGHVILETEGTEFTQRTQEGGVYRVEVYKHKKPWIMANPIYIQK